MITKKLPIMSKEDVDKQLKRHERFLRANAKGSYHYLPADFTYVRLYCEDFSGMNLSYARFYGAVLINVNFSNANLTGASFEGAILNGANFSDANLTGAYFVRARFADVNLKNADMQNANVDLVDFEDATINEDAKLFMPLRCPSSGSFVGWKKAQYDPPESTEYWNHCIVKILVPEDAWRSSAFGNKCRCDKAAILGAYDCATGCPLDESIVIRSVYSFNFAYHVGDIITIPDFDDNRWNECSSGFHFFIDEESAKNYWW